MGAGRRELIYKIGVLRLTWKSAHASSFTFFKPFLKVMIESKIGFGATEMLLGRLRAQPDSHVMVSLLIFTVKHINASPTPISYIVISTSLLPEGKNKKQRIVRLVEIYQPRQKATQHRLHACSYFAAWSFDIAKDKRPAAQDMECVYYQFRTKAGFMAFDAYTSNLALLFPGSKQHMCGMAVFCSSTAMGRERE